MGLRNALLAILIATCVGRAWPAVLSGTVTDKQTTEPLIGASVQIIGTTLGTITDFDGNFILSGLSDGIYDLEVRYISYNTVILREVRISGETVLDFELESADLALQDVEVVAKRNRESENILLLEQKQSLLAVQAIGAKEMSRKGAGDAEAAVAQISGISKQEGVKNVFVRGLGDRYNATTLNGFPIPSEDPEYKNVALDFFGSDMIRNIDVNKVFDASTNGDVGGAAININSKELLGESAFGVEVEGGLNSEIPGTTFLSQDGVNYLGMANAVRPTVGKFDFPNSLDPSVVALPVNHSFALSGGRQFRLGAAGNPLSVFVVASHSTDYAYTQETVRSATADGTVYQDQAGNKYSISTNQLVLANVDFGMGNKHGLSYNFMLLHVNDEYVGDYAGMHTEKFQAADDYYGFSRRQQNNDNLLLTQQLLTEWTLAERWKLDAGVSYNNMKGLEPDRRENYLTRRSDGTYNLTGSNRQKRFFSELHENDFNAKLNVRYKLSKKLDMEQSNIAFGYSGRFINDRFEAVEYNFGAYPGTYVLDGLRLDSLYNSANYDAGRFSMVKGDLNTYRVSKYINSGYVEATHRFTEALTANVGLRADYVNMTVDYRVQHVSPGSEELDKLYWLPSLNLRYDFNDKHSLRFGASKSYTLPQSKEISPYQYVNIGFASQGNPNIKPSDNYNVDLKWDFYLSASELFSVCGFYKHIVNPIGRVDQGNSAGLLTYDNIGKYATVAGAEVELRKNLLNITDENGNRGNKLSLGWNASYIYTNLLLDIANTEQRSSRLEGASPFITNLDLSYSLTAGERNLTASVVLNYFSDRIHTIGTRQYKDIVEKGVVTLDVVASFALGNHITLKLKAANLLNPAHRLVREIGNGAGTVVLNEYRNGMDASFGVVFDM